MAESARTTIATVSEGNKSWALRWVKSPTPGRVVAAGASAVLLAGTFFIDDVEFYHDQGGVTLGKQNLTESLKKNICGKVRRALVPGTLEVPIHGYGAVAGHCSRY